MSTSWTDYLKSAKKAVLTQDGKKKVHYTFPDSTEMAEEFDLNSRVLLVRKWKRKQSVTAVARWEVEVGDSPFAPQWGGGECDGLRESSSSPQVVRTDSEKAFVWRIRNLPYPLDNYDVSIDAPANSIVVRTKNKKYYKQLQIPDMDRLQLSLDQRALQFSHANNTLLILYTKPPPVLKLEEKIKQDVFSAASKDGDVQCAPS